MYHNSLSRYDIDMGKLFPAILLKFKCLFKYVEAIVGLHIPKKFYFKGKKVAVWVKSTILKNWLILSIIQLSTDFNLLLKTSYTYKRFGW